MKLLPVFAAAALLAAPTLAAPCRDAKGKFIKCPPTTATAAPTITKDAKGKCHAPGGRFVACSK